MSNNLPEGYIEGVSRVSNVVEHKFPFGGYAMEQYLKWLKSHGIKETEYMKEAQDVGTFIHLQIEKSILGQKLDISHEIYRKHSLTIEQGIEFAEGLSKLGGELIPEVVVKDKDNRYQGTIDLVRVCEKTKTVWLYDWKTWGIAKEKYGLKNEAKKPTDKLKKVALQLSLYAETYRQKGYKIGGIYVVWIHKTGAYEFSLFEEHNRQKYNYIRLWTSQEIDDLLISYISTKTKLPPDITLKIKFNPMQIAVQTPIPGVDYSRMEVTLDSKDCETFKTPEEAIGQAIKLQKGALLSYKK